MSLKILDRSRDVSTINAVVFLPAYNASSTIAQTLDALQNNPGLKHIKAVLVLDDASRDGTVAAARSAWRSTVPLEICSNLSNAGERTTINSGFARLTADIEWAFILHADDVVKPNWISLYWNEMIGCADDVATICSSWDTWYPESGQIHAGEEFPDKPSVLVKGTRAAVLDTLDRGCWWHISGCAIRVRAFHQIGEFEATLPQTGDWEWLLRCLDKGFSVLYLPRSTLRYRQHGHSVSSISFRRGRDIRERLCMLTSYRDRGYLSFVEYRRKVLGMMYQVARRILVRAVRRDLTGVLHHARVLAEIAAKYKQSPDPQEGGHYQP